jgi:hypothetical protein
MQLGSKLTPPQIWLPILFLVCLVTRLSCLTIQFFPDYHYSILGYDHGDYLLLADSFYRGEPMNIDHRLYSKRGPAYPLYLAGLRVLSSGKELNMNLVYAMQTIQSLLVGWLVFLCGRRCAGEIAGIFAFALYVLDPLYWFTISPNRVGTEHLLNLFLILSLLFFIRSWQNQAIRDLVYTGLCLGCAVLTRLETIGLMPFLFLVWLIKKEKTTLNFSKILLVMSVCGLVLSPWIYRNYTIHHRIVLGTFGGLNFLTQNGGSGGASSALLPISVESFGYGKYGTNEVEIDKAFYKEKIKAAMNQPFQTAKVLFRNLLVTHYFMTFSDDSILARKADPLYGFILVWCLLWIFEFLILRKYPLPFYIYTLLPFWMGFTIIYTFFAYAARMRASFENCLLLLAACSMAHFYNTFRQGFYRRIIFAAAANLILFVLWTDEFRTFVVKRLLGFLL